MIKNLLLIIVFFIINKLVDNKNILIIKNCWSDRFDYYNNLPLFQSTNLLITNTLNLIHFKTIFCHANNPLIEFTNQKILRKKILIFFIFII